MKRKASLLLLLLPSVAVAEVSDKMATIPEVLVQGAVAAAIAFAVSRFRWWLVFIAASWALLLAVGAYGLWEEKHMREAVLHEQGIKYFVALSAEFGCVVASGVLGAFLNRRARRAQQGVQRDGFAAR
ncbi:hypothetical protein [Oleiagrimonas sp. MCCC 1A03011]|uniref:hypothetical protein n=1 Tax=Oleiagrimonas sp. MCCC 1A03011 TaxID=1926883 RepID=UPI000DC4DEA7|nr:hypothetical protein [Oleiagrimonas sp. MCCC 1A03011]RAP57078.1 hypothetical protein BTJ49_10895 [Oleiagrimonas sp. MCCC 1A03011]